MVYNKVYTSYIWLLFQILVWLLGIGIIVSLLFLPKLGLNLLWNILIPIAPALLVLATGVWRNICPLAFTFLIPKKLGIQKRRKISNKLLSKLSLIGLTLLLLIIPSRHLILNNNGLITGIILIAIGLIAFCLGLFFESKSGWCASLCPVHPVEKLYGSKVMLSVTNAHCSLCHKCVSPCPDSISEHQPFLNRTSIYHRIVGYLIVRGFPGYIWGWFQTPDYSGYDGFLHLEIIYGYPLIGMATSMSLYYVIQNYFPLIKKETIVNLFAAASVSCYYWFRIPSLFGFGHFPENGVLINLTNILPKNFIVISQYLVTTFFFWFLVYRKGKNLSWLIRPKFATKNQQ